MTSSVGMTTIYQSVEDSNKRRTPFRSEMPQLLSYQHSILTTLKVDVH